MDEQPRPPAQWSMWALVISVLAGALLGLSTGRSVDELVRPAVGEWAAAVAGFSTAAVVAVCIGVVAYRGLTRKG